MRRWFPVFLIVGLLLLTAVLSDSHEVNRPSIHSAGTTGYQAAHAYLVARGAETAGWEQPLDTLDGVGTLIIALPGVRPITDDDVTALARWIRDGGHLVYLPSGYEAMPSSKAMLAFLRVAEVVDGETPPEDWEAWRTWTADHMRLVADGGTLQLAARTRTTICPVGATDLYQTTDGDPAVCTLKVGRGSLTIVNNATVWMNGQLAEGDNLALLERLTDHPGSVWFDEWHQGASPTVEERDLGWAPTALLAHAGLLYVAFAWAISRPIGLPLRPLAGPSSSMLRELDVLGRLHVAGEHAAAAAERLRSLAATRFRRKGIDARIPPTAVTDEASFVVLAQQIGNLEQEGIDGRSR